VCVCVYFVYIFVYVCVCVCVRLAECRAIMAGLCVYCVYCVYCMCIGIVCIWMCGSVFCRSICMCVCVCTLYTYICICMCVCVCTSGLAPSYNGRAVCVLCVLYVYRYCMYIDVWECIL